LIVALAVLGTVIAVRFLWVLFCTAIMRRHAARKPVESALAPTFRGSVIVSWAGMRGIVSLAAALGLPAAGGAEFPFRDLIVLTAFCVVLGTLLIQGLTLKPLLARMHLHDDDLVGREVTVGRTRAIQAALDSLGNDTSAPASSVREELKERLTSARRGSGPPRTPHDKLRRAAVAAARRTLLRLRETDAIGDDAFHIVEEELDWLEMSGTSGEA
jgi:CPA1 family monovalent cation:H+ antiporter